MLVDVMHALVGDALGRGVGLSVGGAVRGMISCVGTGVAFGGGLGFGFGGGLPFPFPFPLPFPFPVKRTQRVSLLSRCTVVGEVRLFRVSLTFTF